MIFALLIRKSCFQAAIDFRDHLQSFFSILFECADRLLGALLCRLLRLVEERHVWVCLVGTFEALFKFFDRLEADKLAFIMVTRIIE